MYLTGFADEAAVAIDDQIRATAALGWSNIEMRDVNGKAFTDLDDGEFDAVLATLQKSGVRVNCFGSRIANWGKQITDPAESSIQEARIGIPRMKRLGTKLVRVMSFAVLKGRAADDQMEEERFKRMRVLTQMFIDEGLIPVHENCANYGGMGWTYTLRLLENVPDLKLVFDTGNPVQSDDRAKGEPCPRQSAWEFYEHVRDHVIYVHIKDGVWDNTRKEVTWTFPGEGQGDVKRIVKDLLDRGYDGGFSMEPHMAVVYHDPAPQAKAQARYDNYVEYGRRFEQLVRDAGHQDKLA
jgi:sugar phosphate isomerase/epimerase